MLTRARLRGFTLIELLVVIAIIAVLIALLLPAIQQAREAARRSQCQNNLKQMGLAFQNYHSQFNAFPPGGTGLYANNTNYSSHPWMINILPHLELPGVYDAYNQNLAGHIGGAHANRTSKTVIVKVYNCPSGTDVVADPNIVATDPVVFTPHYYGVMGAKSGDGNDGLQVTTMPKNPLGHFLYGGGNWNNAHGKFANTGILFNNSSINIADIKDGTNHTLLTGEISFKQDGYRVWTRGLSGGDVNAGCKNVYHPINSAPYIAPGGLPSWFNDISFGSNHPGGTHFVFADGHVNFISESIDLVVYRASATRRLSDDVNGSVE